MNHGMLASMQHNRGFYARNLYDAYHVLPRLDCAAAAAYQLGV
jgi:hypothetical protein